MKAVDTTRHKYVILLRGVNVGGNHRVPQKEFQSVLETLGFTNVVIYLNSGNAVVTSLETPTAQAVQAALEAHFGFTIPTLVLSGEQIQRIAAAIPASWTNDAPKPDKSGQKSDVVYLFDELDTPNILKRVGYRPEVETLLYVEGAMLSNIMRVHQSRSCLLKIMGTRDYKLMTVRNMTTAKKLAELVGVS